MQATDMKWSRQYDFSERPAVTRMTAGWWQSARKHTSCETGRRRNACDGIVIGMRTDWRQFRNAHRDGTSYFRDART
jgi:hypothetical protein